MNSASAALKGDKGLARQDGRDDDSATTTVEKETDMQTAVVERSERTPPRMKRASRKKAEKTERKARKVKVGSAISGDITEIRATGERRLQIVFENGLITMTPTSNRSVNRDLAVKALRALMKAAS